MNKLRIISAGVAAAMMMTFAACGSGDTDVPIDHPKPTEVTVENSSNSAGKRFGFTLAEFDERMNETLDGILTDGGSDGLDGDWNVLAGGLVDDNGVRYTSYSRSVSSWTLTAAVEDDTEKVMNIGCGCSLKNFNDTKSRDEYITYTAMLACSAGGYVIDDVAFLKTLLTELISGKDSEIYYEMMTYSVSKDKETVMMILSPSSAGIAKNDGARMYE